MEVIKNLIQQEPEKINRASFLELSKKDERGIPRPYPVENPVHHVKLLRGEMGTNKDFKTQKEVEGIWLYFEEEGVEKKYFVPTYYNDKNNEEKYGKFYYLFEKFSDIPEGSLLELEYVKKGAAGYIDVRAENNATKVESTEEIPVINENEDGSYTEDFNEQVNP